MELFKKIPLTQGKFAIVDTEDYERLSAYKWYFQRYGLGLDKGCACRAGVVNGMRRLIRMHYEIVGYLSVDHINGCGIDNRKVNLRKANKSQNAQNVGLNENNTSGYKGVFFDKSIQKFKARIRNKGVRFYLGNFSTASEASEAYVKACIKLHGEFAKWK